jgi:hypothetical protein
VTDTLQGVNQMTKLDLIIEQSYSRLDTYGGLNTVGYDLIMKKGRDDDFSLSRQMGSLLRGQYLRFASF